MREAIAKVEKELIEMNNEIKKMIIDDDESIKSQIARSFETSNTSVEDSIISVEKPPVNFIAAEDVQPKYLGKIGMKNFEAQKALTVERLQLIQENLNQRPADDMLATPPKHLKISLLKHQLHALSFMTWREEQKPRGGILAGNCYFFLLL
jgi:transcription termination factor 2